MVALECECRATGCGRSTASGTCGHLLGWPVAEGSCKILLSPCEQIPHPAFLKTLITHSSPTSMRNSAEACYKPRGILLEQTKLKTFQACKCLPTADAGFRTALDKGQDNP